MWTFVRVCKGRRSLTRNITSYHRTKFPFAVVGCPNINTPPDTYSKRDGNKLRVVCNHTGEMSRLTCDGRRWHGELRNCSSQGKHQRSYTACACSRACPARRRLTRVFLCVHVFVAVVHTISCQSPSGTGGSQFTLHCVRRLGCVKRWDFSCDNERRVTSYRGALMHPEIIQHAHDLRSLAHATSGLAAFWPTRVKFSLRP